MLRHTPVSSRTDTLVPYTTLLRSESLERLLAHPALAADHIAAEHQAEDRQHGLEDGLHGQRDAGPEGDGRRATRLEAAPRIVHNGRDRKSTRLNSSH